MTKVKDVKPKLTDREIQQYKEKFKRLSNSAKYKEAYKLALRLKSLYPTVLLFSYYEAVMTAEDTSGMSKAASQKKFDLAAKKFRYLLRRLRGMPEQMRFSIRNEYYWFSKQHYKQYLLGIKRVPKEGFRGYYSQGVGAAMLARQYGLQGRTVLMIKWARRSELAWKKFFMEFPNWYNAYFFYAYALGFQRKLDEMERAFRNVSRISGKPFGWRAIREKREEVLRILDIN